MGTHILTQQEGKEQTNWSYKKPEPKPNFNILVRFPYNRKPNFHFPVRLRLNRICDFNRNFAEYLKNAETSPNIWKTAETLPNIWKEKNAEPLPNILKKHRNLTELSEEEKNFHEYLIKSPNFPEYLNIAKILQKVWTFFYYWN